MTRAITCAAAEQSLVELALDLSSGDERAELIAHVDECARCRARLAELTEAGDLVVALTPAAEPPVGFEQRVLAALPVVPTARRMPRLVVLGAAAAAILLAVAAGALVLAGRSTSGEREAEMFTPSGQGVGEVYVHEGSPAWALVSVPGWAHRWDGQPYALRVTADDGRVTDLPGGDLRTGGGAWGTTLRMRASDVRSIALVGADGTLWCSATFG